MNSTLKKLMDGIAGMDADKIKPSGEKVERGEVVIGKIEDPELQRLSAYFDQVFEAYSASVDARAKELESAHGLVSIPHNPSTCAGCKVMAELPVEMAYAEMVKDLFWLSIKETLTLEQKIKLAKGGGLALREDWQIVVMPSELSVANLLDGGMGFIITTGSFPR
jgi:hypothetical protein